MNNVNLKTAIFWFRQDLRLSDNPALMEVLEEYSVIPIFVMDEEDPFKMGSCSKWWLYHSLKLLDNSLQNNLNVYTGQPLAILDKIAKENNVSAIYWNGCYDKYNIDCDKKIKLFFQNIGIECKNFSGNLLWEPSQIKNISGNYYKVFSHFYRNGCLNSTKPRFPIGLPTAFNLKKDLNNTISIDDLNLLSSHNWYKKLEGIWEFGEKAAQKKLRNFLENGIEDYKEKRNFPCFDGVYKLSMHIHFGEISVQQIWYAVQKYREQAVNKEGIDCFLSEIGWREFSYYLLYHFPELPNENFQKKFDSFPWNNNKHLLKAWTQGKTGYPIVDAGMRELWQTGNMHNRVRMIVASFLVKNLLIHWHHGRDWFWDCLLDADLASNSASWQWVAGSGADAAPYFRVFNPILQGEKFDPNGVYTRHFVPEIAKLPDEFLFKPWQAPEYILKSSEVTLGQSYPFPIVDLNDSRKIALEGYKNL